MDKTPLPQPEAEVNTLAPYEARARLFCQFYGLDPDKRVGHPHPKGLAVKLYTDQWQLAAAQMQAHEMLNCFLYADIPPGATDIVPPVHAPAPPPPDAPPPLDLVLG